MDVWVGGWLAGWVSGSWVAGKWVVCWSKNRTN